MAASSMAGCTDKENRRPQTQSAGKRKGRGGKRQQWRARSSKETASGETAQQKHGNNRFHALQVRCEFEHDAWGMETGSPSTEATRVEIADSWWDSPVSPVKTSFAGTPTTRASDSPSSSGVQSPRESELAAFLRNDGNAYQEEADVLDSVAYRLVDDVVVAMKEQEMKHRVSLEGLKRSVNLEHRRKIVAWFVQAFHVVCFDDSILYGVIHLADRYLAACGKVVHGTELQGVVMACLCTTLKLETADFLPYSIPDLLAHITHRQISVQRVCAVERDVLLTLDFACTAPSAQSFLDVFALRLTRMAREQNAAGMVAWSGFEEAVLADPVVGCPSGKKPRCLQLAYFLCQLSLINEDLAASRPSLLAASALLLSVHALGADKRATKVLVEDISLIWDLEDSASRAEVAACVQKMLDEWVCPLDPPSARTVKDKFATCGLADLACMEDPSSVSCPPLLRGWRTPAAWAL